MFNYEVKEGEVKIKPGYKPLPIRNYPIAVTFAKFNDKLVVDPGLDEEEVMDARLTMTIEKDGKICAIQKGGLGYFTAEQVFEASKIALQKAEEQRKLVVKE
jgi:exosome complex component RRP42